jgi:hypothetical protein
VLIPQQAESKAPKMNLPFAKEGKLWTPYLILQQVDEARPKWPPTVEKP